MIVTGTCNPTYDKTLEVPGFAAGLTLRARTIRRQPAGKGVNVARCMATLGCPATATGFFMASRRNGSPNSLLFNTSMKVVVPFSIWALMAVFSFSVRSG